MRMGQDSPQGDLASIRMGVSSMAHSLLTLRQGGWSPGPVASRFQVGEIRLHGGPLPSLSFAQPAYITVP